MPGSASDGRRNDRRDDPGAAHLRAACALVTSASLFVATDILAVTILRCLACGYAWILATIATDLSLAAVQIVLAFAAMRVWKRMRSRQAHGPDVDPPRRAASSEGLRFGILALAASVYCIEALAIMVMVRHGGGRIAGILLPLGALFAAMQPVSFLFAMRAMRLLEVAAGSMRSRVGAASPAIAASAIGVRPAGLSA